MILPSNDSNHIRPAAISDIPYLIHLCRICFPGNIKWKISRTVLHNWWERMIKSDAADVSVIANQNGIAGFSLLILNEIKAKEISISRLNYWMSALFYPRIAFRRLVEYIFVCAIRKSKAIVCVQSPADWGPKIRTWLELIATYPEMRGRGLGGMLLNHCIERSRNLGRKVIALRVTKDNQLAKALYERHGYVRLRSDLKGETYVLYLDSH